MKPFPNENFMLHSETARALYTKAAKDAPVYDYHCHLSPKEIYEDRRFTSITEVWLGGDHYKWRLMRAAGLPERLITGDAPDREKFMAWASVMPKLLGSPLYHWSHLELYRYFGIDAPLSPATAGAIYDRCGAMLQTNGFSARGLIERSNVAALCTTDDPADGLHYHKLLAEEGFPAEVLPAWRPDAALSIEKADFPQYIARLKAADGGAADTIGGLCGILKRRMDHFAANGCRLSDHGMADIPFRPVTEEEADAVYQKALRGEPLSDTETEGYKTFLLAFLGKEYARRGWAMQLHLGVTRNRNSRAFKALGADTGFDGIGGAVSVDKLYSFLDMLDAEGALPKTVLYSLNPGDNAALDVLAPAFPGEGVRSKVQHGAAWWFNDNARGMREQLQSYAEQGVLGNFIGMLTDSRSFLSYARHDYFRRILCDFIGERVEKEEYPQDWETLTEIVEGVCWKNAKEYFGF